MPTREEMRQDYQRKKTLHKSALMFLYTLGVLGAGIAFQDELQGGFEKIQTYASNTNQNQTGTVQKEAKQMARTNSDMAAQTNGKADLTSEEALEIFNQLFPDAAQNKAKQTERTNSDMAAQNIGAELISEQTLETLNQILTQTTPPTVTIPLRVDSAVNVAGREGVKTDGFVMKGFKAAGLLNRLSNLQGGKSLLLNKGQNSLTDVKLSQFSEFEKMGLERTVGSVQPVKYNGAVMYPFGKTAQKTGLSKTEIDFITQGLAGDIELGNLGKNARFEVLTAPAKDGKAREVVYVALTVQGKKHERYAWADKNGEKHFYTPDGTLPAKKIMHYPVESQTRISSPFGVRKHPVTGDVRMHKGVDLALPTGTPIKAAADGIVSYVGRDAGYGNWVEIKHKNGYKTRYAHLNQFEKGLKVGTKVHAGQNIAQGGNTGRSTGSHLHYEVRIDGKPVNPMSAYRIEGAKKLEADQMGKFLAFVDVVHKGPSNLFHKDLKGALAHASLNENGNKSALASVKDTNRIPVESFRQRKTARGL